MNIYSFLRKIKIHSGYVAIAIVLSVYLFHILNVRFWSFSRGIIFWDTLSYYAYLPATFIYDDLSLKFIDEDPDLFRDKFWPERIQNKNYVIKTSMGLSILYSPFFFLAHFYAHFSGYEADGYSPPYHAGLAFSSFFYIIFGFIFLYKILRRYISEWITALTILSVGIATNLFAYTTQSPTMPHSFNFTLITLFIWLTIKWHQVKNIKYSVFIGLTAGLIILIRPTNALILFIFLLYNIKSLKDISLRINEILINWKLILLILFMAFLVWIPQMIYWKTQTGNLLFFSYSGERFFWTEPEIIKGLFGFRKGFFIYTPLMIFAVIGFFFLNKKSSEWMIAVPVTFILACYVVLSWWSWWYGGGFGMRPFIDYYGLLAIPIAAFLTSLTDFSKWIKGISIVLFAIAFLFGIFHYIQYYYGAIHWDSMTWKAYKHSFLKVHDDEELEKYLEHPDYEKAKQTRRD